MVARKAWDDRPSDRRPDPANFAGGRAVRQAVDLDQCPAGYDPDVWDMALLFEQRATDRGIRLMAGRPVLYSMMLPRMEWLKNLADTIDRTKGSFSVDGVTRWATWQEMGRAAIELFWRPARDILETVPGPYAADDFCHPLEFPAIIRDVRRKGINKHSQAMMEAAGI